MAVNGRSSDIGEDLRKSREEASAIGSEIAGLAAELRTLGNLEVELARAEMQENRSRLVRTIAMGAGAAILAHLALAFLFVGAMFALDEVLELWLSALITAGGLLVLGGILGLLARNAMKRFSVVPQRTVNSIKEDIQWARSQLTSSAR